MTGDKHIYEGVNIVKTISEQSLDLDDETEDFPGEKEITQTLAQEIALDIDRKIMGDLERTWREEHGWFQPNRFIPLGFNRTGSYRPVSTEQVETTHLPFQTVFFSEDDDYGRKWSRPVTPIELIGFLVEEDLG